MTAPMGLAEVVPREAKGHGKDSSGKGHGGQEAWHRGSKVCLSQAESWALATGMEKKGTVELLEAKELVRTRREGRR